MNHGQVRDKTCKVIWGGYLLRVDGDILQFEMHKFAEQEAKKRQQIITSALDLGRRLHPEVAQKLVGLFSVKNCSHGMVLAEQHGDINDIFVLETATCATRLELKFCKAAARPEASSGMSEKSRNEMYAVPNKLMTKYIHLNSAGPMDCLGLTDWASACKAAVEKRRTGGGGHVHLAEISAHWIASMQVVNEGTVLVANRHRMMAFLEAYYDGEIPLLEALRLQQERKINARASRIMAGIANFEQHGLVMAQADALFLKTMFGSPEEEMVGRRAEVAIQKYMTEQAQAHWWSGVLDIPGSLNKPLPTWADVHRSGRTGRAGMVGRAITLATHDEAKYIGQVETLIGRPIPMGSLPGYEQEAPGHDQKRKRRRGGRSRLKDDARPETPTKTEETETPPVISTPGSRRRPASADTAAPKNAEPEPKQRSRRRRIKTDDAPPTPFQPLEKARETRINADREPVVGLGDHVPAFLMASIPVATEADLGAEEKKPRRRRKPK